MVLFLFFRTSSLLFSHLTVLANCISWSVKMVVACICALYLWEGKKTLTDSPLSNHVCCILIIRLRIFLFFPDMLIDEHVTSLLYSVDFEMFYFENLQIYRKLARIVQCTPWFPSVSHRLLTFCHIYCITFYSYLYCYCWESDVMTL